MTVAAALLFIVVLSVALIASSPRVRHRVHVVRERRRHGIGRHDV